MSSCERRVLRGTEQKGARLTEDQVAEIIATHVRYCRRFGATAQAKRRGVTKAIVLRIIAGTAWPHVPRPAPRQPIFFHASDVYGG